MKDICTQLEDGIYPIRDVMQYLECKKGESNFVNCPKGTIYVSGKNCTNATKFNEGIKAQCKAYIKDIREVFYKADCWFGGMPIVFFSTDL